MRTIAYVRNERRKTSDDDWDDFISTIELADDVPSSSLRGLEEFSHVEIVFFAALAQDVPPGPWHRRPRDNDHWPDVGIFAHATKIAQIGSCSRWPYLYGSTRARSS